MSAKKRRSSHVGVLVAILELSATLAELDLPCVSEVCRKLTSPHSSGLVGTGSSGGGRVFTSSCESAYAPAADRSSTPVPRCAQVIFVLREQWCNVERRHVYVLGRDDPGGWGCLSQRNAGGAWIAIMNPGEV